MSQHAKLLIIFLVAFAVGFICAKGIANFNSIDNNVVQQELVVQEVNE